MATPSSAPDYSNYPTLVLDFLELATAPPAIALVSQAGLDVPSTQPLRIFDNASGGGVLTAEILKVNKSANLSVICGEIAEDAVAILEGRFEREKWKNVDATLADAQSLDFDNASFTHHLTNFGHQLIADPTAALNESHRVLQRSGTVGFTCWVPSSGGWLGPFHRANPGLPTPPVFLKWSDPQQLTAELTSAGFGNIQINRISRPVTFPRGVKDFVRGIKSMMNRVGSSKIMDGELGDRYQRYLLEEFGEGPLTLPGWEALVVTAKKE